MLIPEFLYSNYPWVHRVGAPPRESFIPLNTMNKNLASNLLTQGSIEQEYLSKNEVYDKNKKFSTEFQY